MWYYKLHGSLNWRETIDAKIEKCETEEHCSNSEKHKRCVGRRAGGRCGNRAALWRDFQGAVGAALWRPQATRDAIGVKNNNVSRQLATKNLELSTSRAVPDWLSLTKDEFKGVLMRIPTRDDINPIANEQAVVEFYSR